MADLLTVPGRREDALRRRLEVIVGKPFTEGNELTVLRNGDRIFPAMLDAIRAAERTVDFMTFVYWKGDIAREFARRLRHEGVPGRARAGADRRARRPPDRQATSSSRWRAPGSWSSGSASR